MLSARKWAENEFGEAELGDERRRRRLIAIAAEVGSRPAGTVNGACATSATREGTFRFLRNAGIDAAELQSSVARATTRRSSEKELVFVAVDGTSLCITDRNRSKGIGAVGSWHQGARGMYAMTALVVDELGAALGIGAQKLWCRERRSRRDPKGRPARGGESLYWQEVIEDCSRALGEHAPQTRAWYQMDRGADCWQVLSFAKEAGHLVTVRAVHDRRVDDCVHRLWSAIEMAPVRATRVINVRKSPPSKRRQRRGKERFNQPTGGQKARKAKVHIRAATVPLRLTTPTGQVVVEYNAVLVQEAGKSKQRLCWLLLTTAPIRTRDEVLQVVRGYTLRWRVEDFHRAWKQGLCCVEDTQLRSRSAIAKWVTILAAVATRAMRLCHQARATPDVPATDELTPTELEAIVLLRQSKKPINKAPTLLEAVRWIAELGGYGGPWNGPPGPTTIGRGLDRVELVARAFELRDKM